MTVTYTNDMEAVSDGLYTIIEAEFKPRHVEMCPEFEADKMTRGEYIRYWFLDSTSEKYASGETRFYIIEVVFYFDKARRLRKTFDDRWSERVEQLKRLLMNNSNYSPSGTYIWHNIEVNLDPIETLEDTDVQFVRFELKLSRGNNW